MKKLILLSILLIVGCDYAPTEHTHEDCAGEVGGTAELDNCNVCDSNKTNDCIPDCAGIWGGESVVDECGVCDSDLTNNCVPDCAGVWGGTSILSGCDNVCNSTAVVDCDGNCWDAYSFTLNLGNGQCNSPGSGFNLACEEFNCDGGDCLDCAGECGGAVVDDCGVCGGDGSTCIVCADCGDAECCDCDGNVYATVQIGTQLWMAENLKVTHYNGGDGITHITNDEDWGSDDEGQYAIYDNDPSNAEIYGNLYNWAVVYDNRGVCPDDFHMPSDDEWMILIDYLGGNGVAGRKMKETGIIHWNSPNTGATNESGFTALPAGYYSYTNEFMGMYGYFWSNSTNGINVSFWQLAYNNSNAYNGQASKTFAMSVRCINNNN